MIMKRIKQIQNGVMKELKIYINKMIMHREYIQRLNRNIRKCRMILKRTNILKKNQKMK